MESRPRSMTAAASGVPDLIWTYAARCAHRLQSLDGPSQGNFLELSSAARVTAYCWPGGRQNCRGSFLCECEASQSGARCEVHTVRPTLFLYDHILRVVYIFFFFLEAFILCDEAERKVLAVRRPVSASSRGPSPIAISHDNKRPGCMRVAALQLLCEVTYPPASCRNRRKPNRDLMQPLGCNGALLIARVEAIIGQHAMSRSRSPRLTIFVRDQRTRKCRTVVDVLQLPLGFWKISLLDGRQSSILLSSRSRFKQSGRMPLGCCMLSRVSELGLGFKARLPRGGQQLQWHKRKWPTYLLPTFNITEG
ncbi:hypothetical protein B0H63DRAFT_110216 [Podospora didyma]|uniref:EGF-like domain-containing protein n=1 Tax=Podospora didyma TaxID=330526 RepID=A0AAE0NZJ0_9PEZI|nr:hypothetical protein B0H63DRAFT_110216 [Podospora didyma]